MKFSRLAERVSSLTRKSGMTKPSLLFFIFFSIFILGFRNITDRFAAGVIAELRLDEGTGTNAADVSGNAHNGTLTNGAAWATGKYGQGVNLDGSNDYINIADHNNFTLDPTLSYSWSGWVKNNNFNEWSTVWSQTLNTSNFFYFYAHTSTDPDGGPVTNGISVYWWVNNGASKLGVHSNNNVLTAGQWSYVAVTYNAALAQNNRFTIYVNGVDVTNRTDVASVGTLTTINPTNIRVGSNQPYGEYLNGAVDEVRYYRRLLSAAEVQSDMNIGNAPDTQFPTAAVTAPANGATVSGTVNVAGTATDNTGVTGVQFLLDGVNLGAEDLTAPYSVSWNSTTASNGAHALTARSRDAAGNTTTSAVVNVTINNFVDGEAPTISITAPAAGNVSGTINVNSNAADNIGVVGVQFLLDGANLGSEDITAPYSVSWASTGATNGSHTLTARARDAAGNTATSAAVIVNVVNTNLVAAFGFNENTGGTANDNSGNGNNGTLANGPTWSASGRYGAAILFDGTNDLVNINDANSLDLTNGMTIEAWVNPSNLTGYKTILCKENGTNNLSYALSPNNNTSGTANQRPNSRLRIGITTRTVTGTTKLALNTWAHMASTYDGANFRLYINGVLVATTAGTGSMTATTNPLRIGGSTALAQYFTGLIDEVRIYNRALSVGEIQTDMNTPIAPDQTAPTVSISAPATGNTVSATIVVNATAADNISVTGVQFLLDGVNLGAEDLTAPYSTSWNTSTAANGSHILTARARDAAGNTTTSTEITVTVNNDTQAPTVSITEPATGATVAATITLSANATDNTAVAGVQFLLNGVALGAEDISAPFSISWNTTSVVDGNYSITARARDAAGNTTLSTVVSVTVLNTVPDTEGPTVSVAAPAAGDVSGSISIIATATDNTAVVGVQFLLNGAEFGAEDITAPYSIPWNTLSVANGPYAITARARDAAGNITLSQEISVTVNNIPDSDPPTVAISAPAAGNVSGTINVTATAADNTGVAGVQFQLDGVALGAEDLVAPFTVSWNTTTTSNGSHSLVAVARDAAGNITNSAAVAVTVNNDITAPLIAITAPGAGNVSGTINISADASDNVAVVGVQFLLDGANLGSEDLVAPYTISWNTVAASNGSHTLTARARDAAGNIKLSTGVAVSVSNNTNLIAALGLNENTGTNAVDISGNNHNGTLTNGPVWAAGKYGQGVTLDGANDYINIADHNNFSLDPTQSYTWSAWVRNTNFREWTTVWSQTINTSNFFYFYAHTSTDPDGGPVTNGVSVYWWVNNGASKLGAHSSNNVLTAGQWSHITVTYNGTLAQNNRFSIYVNGVDVTVRTDVSSVGTITAINPTSIRIGSNQPFGEYLTGAVDEVRYYTRLLTPAQVLTDMNTPIEVDNIPPAVSITAPVAGATVSGVVNVTANASDNAGVAGVQFYVDGVALGAEDLVAPYSVSWNTETATNGNHILTAKARDAAGNNTTSADHIVTVGADFTFEVLTPVKNTQLNGSTDYRINVSYLNGFITSSGISLSFSGLPATVTGHYLFNPMSHQGETQLFLNVNSTPLGTYPFTMSAVSEGITHTQQATLNITAAADFSITASPSIQNVTRGGSTSFTININETNDFVNPVTLSVTGLPAGVNASFNQPAPVPAATSILTLTTTAAAAAGTYNLIVQGTSGAIIKTTPITLTITTAPSVWTVTTMGSTGVPNNTVRLGHLKPDGLERVYVGTIETGRMLEYSWSGSSWAGPVDVGGSPSGQEIHNCTIGAGRGDGKERMYIASYDLNIYEIWNDATGWHQLTVGGVGNLGMHTVVGDGRNDGVTRLYAASTQQLFEFTWNGTSWTKLLIGSTPGAHELALGNGRRDGKNRVYIASISSGNFEASYNGTSWSIVSMGDNGDARGLELGDGRNDGIIRVYSGLYDGRIREFTWSGAAWTFVNMPMAGTQNIHAYILPGRNDGVNRVYTCNANGKVFEYTWNGASWDIYNMGGGSDYMYGLHYGYGRNDGILRFYGADRGSVNRVYEFTWTVPPLIVFKREDEQKDIGKEGPVLVARLPD